MTHIAASGSQWGLTSSHAWPMKSHDRNSAGSATDVTNGGMACGGGGEKATASSGSVSAGTGAASFFRISVALRTRPSRSHSSSPGRSTGPYSLPSGARTKY